MKNAASLAVLLALAAAPAVADWIVLRNGEPIATAGPWEERGNAVVFTAAEGGLFLLPSSEIDWPETMWKNLHPARREVARFVSAHGLEISDPTTLRWVVGTLVVRHRNRFAATSAAAAPRRPRFVVTDADVAHVSREVALPAEEFPVKWRRSFDGVRPGDLLIVGELENRSELTVRAVKVELRLLDADGEPVESLEVEVEPPVVAPGDSARFRCQPQAGGFSEIEIAATGRPGRVD